MREEARRREQAKQARSEGAMRRRTSTQRDKRELQGGHEGQANTDARQRGEQNQEEREAASPEASGPQARAARGLTYADASRHGSRHCFLPGALRDARLARALGPACGLPSTSVSLKPLPYTL